MSLEKEEKRIQFERVRLAKLEMEFKIKQREADIERLKEHIKTQDKRLKELNEEMGE